MNIHHFESGISGTVLDKGYNYYVEGHVIDIYHQGDHEYIIQVEGSDDYEVVVKLNEEGTIIYSRCDCPYA